MKKLLLILLTFPFLSNGQTTDLFFSEYAEGSSNNKYLEIYNGTGSEVDLGNYVISNCSNGCNVFGTFDFPATITWPANTMLPNGSVYKIVHPNANAALVAQADLTFSFLSNGDDAFALVTSTGTVIDIIGDMQGDPGTGWPVAGIANGTVDRTLVRKMTVCQGNPVELSSFGTDALSSEWEVLPIDTWTNFGFHVNSCAWAICDSYAILNEIACGEYVGLSGNVYNTSGNYIDTSFNAAMCDSFVYINLIVNPVYTGITDEATICDGQTYVFGTQSLTTAGDYVETFQSVNNCDSTVTLTLSVVASYNENISASICEGESYILGAQTLTSSGFYTELFTTGAGCDSTVNLTLTVNPITYNAITVDACDSYVSPSGNYTWTMDGVYNDTIPNANMCDSVITITLTLGTSDLIEETVTACDSYVFESTEYTSSGTYQVVYENESGCDSTLVLYLTITETPAIPTTNGDQTLCTPDLPSDLEALTSVGGSALIITGVVDGPLVGGLPKVVSFYAINDIADLSVYGFGSATNGGGSDGIEFTFPNVALTAGQHYHVTTDDAGFSAFFGFNSDAVEGLASNNNGDDAIELFLNGSVVDVFGDINADGSGLPWDYLDGWAYRNSGSQPNNGVFNISEWTMSGIDVFDGQTTNATSPTPYPVDAFSTTSIEATYTWYSEASLTTELSSDPIYATGQTSGTEDYYVVASSLGCDSEAAMVTITINETPEASLSLTAAPCVNHDAFTLTGGLPAGGTYSGTGVSGGMFDPATAGVGSHEITYTVTENGCSDNATATIVVSACASIDEFTTASMKVYPNPTSGNLTISQETASNLEVTVTDLSGKIIVATTVSNAINTIDLSTVEAGQYIITLKSSSSIERMTIVKN